MRTILLVLTGAFLLGACSSGRQSTASAVGLVSLENYFVKNNVALPDGYNYKVVTSQQEFDADFGMAAAMSNTVRRPDFSGQTVVAVIAKMPGHRRIVMDGATIGGDQLHVYYHAGDTVPSSYAMMGPGLGLATVPRALSVKKANFYQDSVLVKTVPVSIY